MKYRKLKDWKYELLKPMSIDVEMPKVRVEEHSFIYLKDNQLTVRSHYAWDGPSGPTIDTPSFMRGSLFHDVLYQLIREGNIDHSWKEYADRLLQRICIADGMSKFRTWYVYWGVHIFGEINLKPSTKPRDTIVELEDKPI